MSTLGRGLACGIGLSTPLFSSASVCPCPRSGRSVQYCMPYAHDLLSGAALSAVTNARATGDYHIGSSQWAVGGGAMLIWALGMLPFKDGFYSSTDIQPGGQNEGPELRPVKATAVLAPARFAPGPAPLAPLPSPPLAPGPPGPRDSDGRPVYRDGGPDGWDWSPQR